MAPLRRAFDVRALNPVDWRKNGFDIRAWACGRLEDERLMGCPVMLSRLADLNGHNDPYFDRAPEKLVLEGYRRLIAGFETGSIAPWELSWSLYQGLLGEAEGARALSELTLFVRALRKCASCPLRAFPFGAHHVSREECLALGLVAGLQHKDEATVSLCAGAMSCPLRSVELSRAAIPLANTLARLDHTLLPIPLRAIEDIIARSSRAATVH